jgi:hypothetical protein
MKLTMPFNHWLEVMFRKFSSSVADHCAANDTWFQGTAREKNAVRGGSDGILEHAETFR